MEIRPACLLCFRRRFACLCSIRNQLHKKKARQEKGNLRMKKRVVSLLLAAVMVLASVGGVGGTAKAAGTG